jgi:hypothetical protein
VGAPSDAKMSEKAPNRSPEPLFKVRQIFILFALVLVFSFAVRLASGDPLPHDIQDFFASMLGLKHRGMTALPSAASRLTNLRVDQLHVAPRRPLMTRSGTFRSGFFPISDLPRVTQVWLEEDERTLIFAP